MMFSLQKRPVKRRNTVNPRVRAYGKARLDIASRAQTREDWDRMWKPSTFPFPFKWEKDWKYCIEYKVVDFAAEVGFLIDILGLEVHALDSEYAMFTSPGKEFYFAVIPVPEGYASTPPDAIRLQFLVTDILNTAQELERRGVKFEMQPQPISEGSAMLVGYFRTPNGICIDLWGVGDYEAPGEDLPPFETAPALEQQAMPIPATRFPSQLEEAEPEAEISPDSPAEAEEPSLPQINYFEGRLESRGDQEMPFLPYPVTEDELVEAAPETEPNLPALETWSPDSRPAQENGLPSFEEIFFGSRLTEDKNEDPGEEDFLLLEIEPDGEVGAETEDAYVEPIYEDDEGAA